MPGSTVITHPACMGCVVMPTSCTSSPSGWPTPCMKYFLKAALSDKLVRKLSLDVHLLHAGPREAQHTPESVLGETAGPPDQLQLDFRFDGSQTMHQRSEPFVIVQRIAPQHVRHKSRFAAFHF